MKISNFLKKGKVYSVVPDDILREIAIESALITET